ncbi:MAG: type III-B CRISPR module-associated Cmr3 family protein [bacterium]|nr:type III-B CRISPR module-associated Cmr3 family protein [bacterium]
METKYSYLVRLTPLAPYFFGGENTFDEGAKANYLARSNQMPSQATLLGVMRYVVLRQRGLLGLKNQAACEKVIGPSSFSFDQSAEPEGREADYGIIARLSPLFLRDNKEGDYFTAMPLDDSMDFGMEAGRSYLSGKVLDAIPCAKDLNVKTYDHYLHFVNPDRERLADRLKERHPDEPVLQMVFHEEEQIGITKNKKERHGTDEDAFFKQILVTLHTDLSFAFVVETYEPIQTETDMVFMGANRSMFKMEISQPDSLPDFFAADERNYFARLARPDRYLLLSDAYLQPELWQKARFVWGQAVAYRAIKSQVRNGLSWKKPKKSALYRLQARGSVLRGAHLDELLTMPAFQQVGWNIYVAPSKNIE